MVRLLNKKRIIFLSLLLLIVAIVITGFLVFDSKDKNEEPSTQTGVSNQTADETKPAQEIESLSPPPKTTPEICKNIDEKTISGFVGSQLKFDGGRTANTDKEAAFSECNYSKDNTKVVVRIYEYKNEAAAKSNLSEQKITGFVAKNKGKFNVSVSVSSETSLNNPAADKIVDAVMEKL